jgi:4-amino-4-deoxy-L-arabinose transferase-like glycosyltransferase
MTARAARLSWLRPLSAAEARSAAFPVAVAAGLFLLLALFVAADPAPGFTFSASPWSDEGWRTLGARNLVLLGHWSTDQWNLYLIEAPFSALMAVVFRLFGVGIVQARLLCIGMVALAVLSLGLGLRRSLGLVAATLAALALATDSLLLYYGRLVYLEDLVLLGLALGALTLVRAEAHPGRWGLVAGIALAIAIGAKANGIPPAFGLVAGVALFGLVADRRFLRWAAGAVTALAAAGVAWAIVVYLPNRAQIADVLRILAQFGVPGTLAGLRAQLFHMPFTDGLLLRTWPLVLVGITGALLALLSPEARRGVRGALLFGALGWLLVGGGTFAVFTYQPNRYFLPMLPALALLVACGAGVAWPWLRGHAGPLLRTAGLGAVAILLAMPGLIAYGSWMAHATYALPTMQEQARSLVPPGSITFGGLAPTLLMRAPVVTIARTVGAQADADLYVTRGVRWFVTGRDAVVEPVARLHPAAWAARSVVYCHMWGDHDVCLYHLP